MLMAIHDWTKVSAGLFHDFHQSWAVRIKDALNAGILPRVVSAVLEKPAAIGERLDPARERELEARWRASGVAALEEPVTLIVKRNDRYLYAQRANRVVIKHHL